MSNLCEYNIKFNSSSPRLTCTHDDSMHSICDFLNLNSTNLMHNYMNFMNVFTDFIVVNDTKPLKIKLQFSLFSVQF